MQLGTKQVTVYLKLDPKTIESPPSILRDVTEIGHYGTGDTEVSVDAESDLALAKPLIEKAYRQVGG
jgi:predicted transport protein